MKTDIMRLMLLAAAIVCPKHAGIAAGEKNGAVAPDAPAAKPVATYSIVAFDPATGDLGVAVQSKFFGVGSVVPWAKAGVGAVATQSYANVAYGPEGLKLLAGGKTASEVLRELTEKDPGKDVRQAAIADARGNVAAFTGEKCNAWAGDHQGRHYSVQGNILASKEVVAAMAASFEAAREKEKSGLADALVAALTAGEEAGGDKRGRQSAALLVVRKGGGYAGGNDRFVDLRVEDHATPVKELLRLLELHKNFYRKAHANPPAAEKAEEKEKETKAE